MTLTAFSSGFLKALLTLLILILWENIKNSSGLFLNFEFVFVLWASRFSDGVSCGFGKTLTASKVRVNIYHEWWQWAVGRKLVMCSSNQADLFCLIIYSNIEHVNMVPFKFVPHLSLAGALSFTVPSTYITSESGCWIDWLTFCPWFRGWHLYRRSWDSQISRTWLLLHLRVIFPAQLQSVEMTYSPRRGYSRPG